MKNRFITAWLLVAACYVTPSVAQQVTPDRRVIIFMLDGFGVDYLESSDMPNVKNMLIRNGLYKEVQGMMPSLTNCNNASICCGTAADEHGVVGNTFFNSKTGEKEFLERGELVLAPTIFQRAARHGVRSALFSSKLKTIPLLSAGTDLAVCPETASPDWIAVAGKVPGKYSREVNYWTIRCALHTLKTRPDIGLLYIHTTDYAMHMWRPEDRQSREHLFKLDSLIGEVVRQAPDAAIFITADHGMNHKRRVWDLQQALANRGVDIQLAISPLADKYPKHHSGYGGSAYVYLKASSNEEKVRKTLLELPGIEAVYSKQEAASRYHLMPERIGDLFVVGDKETVFGELEEGASKALPDNFRTHGSEYERRVPLIIYNMRAVPPASFFTNNKDIARWLY